jgi:hypothetical protein
MVLDTEFLLYAITEKVEQSRITGLTTGLIMEANALANKVNNNEHLPDLCRISVSE